MAGITAFREAYMMSDSAGNSEFGDWAARQVRYAVLWALFENTAYRNIHTWATKLKVDYGLYRWVRNVYNPANRTAIFWQTHIWGGSIDPAVGDGSETPNALPVLTDNAGLRKAIGQVFAWSNWQARKDIVTLWGVALGDVFLKVLDAPARGKVQLSIVHPGTVKEIMTDDAGNVRYYVIEEQRPDPSGQTDRDVRYTEIAERVAGTDDVQYTTLLNNTPYAWNGQSPTWSEPYGFIPIVQIQHNDIGVGWGWAEVLPVFGKCLEVDDVASKVNDQIRKLVDSPWLFAGVDKPKAGVRTAGAAASADRPEPGREEIPALYGPVGATATALVAPLDLAAALKSIEMMLAEIERDLPELQADIWTSAGDASGRALRVARQRIEAKAKMRRVNYDDGLRRALQMAVSIGGLRGYFPGFDLGSYARGDEDFAFGDRPVFPADPLDLLELERARLSVEALRQQIAQQSALNLGA